jgi:hypothetical protein
VLLELAELTGGWPEYRTIYVPFDIVMVFIPLHNDSLINTMLILINNSKVYVRDGIDEIKSQIAGQDNANSDEQEAT